MKRNVFGCVLAMMLLLCGLAAVAADTAPTLEQVYATARAGDLAGADRMMQQVLKAHPDSAKAHYVHAEVLARQRAYGPARQELAAAERLAPGLPFAKPGAVNELRATLASAGGLAGTPVMGHAARGGLPWWPVVLGLGVIALLFLLVRVLSPRGAVPAPVGAAGAQPPVGMPMAGMMTPPSGGLGSSLASGLATGLGVGAGIAAGEALVQHFTGGGQPQTMVVPDAPPNYDMGGDDFGVSDGGGWDDAGGGFDDAGGGDWS